jgi:hypothetical protein
MDTAPDDDGAPPTTAPLHVRLPPPTTTSRPPRPRSLSANILPDLPPISALFLIEFDVKAGYTISWRRQSPGPDVPGAPQLDGLVEYKSLPSGLHTVAEDLVYFVHEGNVASAEGSGSGSGRRHAQGYAGLGAFVNIPCDDEGARHARMIAVGVLVPLTFGRLGRAWRHAEGLKELSSLLAKDRTATAALERYWDQHKPKGAISFPSIAVETPIASPGFSMFQQPPRIRGHVRQRSASDGNAPTPQGHKLSPYHPAWSLMNLLDTFGPLIFPIHRAALLRQRILISCHVPVRETCNFVYIISILSNIPLAVNEFITPPKPAHRLRPLFNIGVHDIPFLVQDGAAAKRRAEAPDDPDDDDDDDGSDETGTGWVACTTDSILAMKDTLWDMLITLPGPHVHRAASQEKGKPRPTVECPRGVPVKATQRDLRRYRALRAGLARHFDPAPTSSAVPPPHTPGVSAETEPTGINLPDSRSTQPPTDDNDNDDDDDQDFDAVVEPASWTALAYNGFMWWASAGEQPHGTEQDETAHDNSLLADLVPTNTTMGPSRSNPTTTATSDDDDGGGDDEARKELAIIAYFHRLTTQMLHVLSGQIDYNDRYGLSPYSDSEPAPLTTTNPSTSTPSSNPSDNTAAAANNDSDDSDSDAEENDLLLQQHQQPRGDSFGSYDSDDDDSDLVPGESVRVDARVFREMGVDMWSRRDAEFVAALAKMYFGRETREEGKGVEICGVRVC